MDEAEPCSTCRFVADQEPVLEPTLQTQLQHLLSHNAPPHPADSEIFHTVASDMSVKLRDVERRIAHHHEDIKALEKWADSARSSLADVTAVMHPIRRTPTEILREIFLFVLFADCNEENTIPDTLSEYHPAWTVAEVCQRWRHTALSFPLLWSYLKFNMGTLRKISPRLTVRRLNNHLLRSTDYGITLDVYADRITEVFGTIMGMLEATTPRWVVLRTEIPTIELQKLLGYSFPRLRTLDLTIPEFEPSPGAVDAFSNSPSLRNLRLVLDPGNTFTLPCSRVISYILCEPSLSSFTLLRQMSNLEQLTIEIEYMFPVTLAAFGHINSLISSPVRTMDVFEALDTTAAQNGGGAYLSLCLSHLEVPNLTRLSLELAVERASFPRFHVPPPSLTDLTVVLVGDSGPALRSFAEFLLEVPTITSLSVSGVYVTCGFAEHLTADLFLPRLTTLSMEGCHTGWTGFVQKEDHVERKQMLDALEYRTYSNHTPGRAVSVLCEIAWDTETLAWMSSDDADVQDTERWHYFTTSTVRTVIVG